MRAVGAGARHQLGMAADEQRRAFVLHDGGKRLGAIDPRALVGLGQAQQHGGDVAGGQGRGKRCGERSSVGDRRRHQIEAGRRARLGRVGLRSHHVRMVA